MSRSTKFRGRQVDNSEWIYGDLVHFDGKTQISLPRSEWIKGITTTQTVGGLIEVVPETVGQFTGLKDKNVWEGDICESEDGLRRFVVTWDDRRGCWYLKGIGKAWNINDPNWNIFKVIGDIHSNPELLEEKPND